jgi:hypothetical protein
MKWLKDLWNRIVSSNDEQYLIKIKELETTIGELNDELARMQSELSDEIDNYLFMKEQFELMQETKNKLLEELEALKHIEADYEIPHEIIDVNSFGYMPNAKFYYYNTSIKKIDAITVQFTPSKFYRVWSDEMFKFFRDAVKNCKTFDEKVVKLRDVIKNRVTYKHDVNKSGTSTGENWRLPTDTFYGKIGDCEDTTILWVTACHICGIPADRVFNGTGHYKHPTGWIGHSFGLAKFDDGNWRVRETTSKRQPLLFKNNKEYKITANNILNGLSNWAMSGKGKKETF